MLKSIGSQANTETISISALQKKALDTIYRLRHEGKTRNKTGLEGCMTYLLEKKVVPAF